MMERFLGDKVNNQIISSKTANFDAKILNLVNFFCESIDFCRRSLWQQWFCRLWFQIILHAYFEYFFRYSGV